MRYITLIPVVFLLSFCQVRDKPGCKDPAAVNFDRYATLRIKTCIYPRLIQNPGFEESNEWWFLYPESATYGPSWAKEKDGMMPTEGSWYMRCINSSQVEQGLNPNHHFKGYYVDYRYKGKLDANGMLNVKLEIQGVIANINETTASLNGSDSVIVEKRDQFFPMSHSQTVSKVYFEPFVSAGTFTLEVDNIRMVQDDE